MQNLLIIWYPCLLTKNLLSCQQAPCPFFFVFHECKERREYIWTGKKRGAFHYIHCSLSPGGLPNDSTDQLIQLWAGLILNNEHNTPLSLQGSVLIQQLSRKLHGSGDTIYREVLLYCWFSKTCNTWKIQLRQEDHLYAQ